MKGALESLRAERDRLNESARLLRSEAARWREERDKANLEASEIRSRLKLHYEELKEKRKRLEELEAILRERRRRTRPKREIRDRITRLEWEVSTTPTLEMLPRERELLEKARALYEELRECEELEEQRNMALMLLSEIKAIEIRVKEYKEKLVKLREVSKERHEKMIIIYRKAEEEKKRADNIHSKILENISEMKKFREELKEVLKEINMVKKEIKEKSMILEAERKILIEERKKEIAEKARRKLEAGGKISLEELKIIFEEKEEKDGDEG
ncbi:hypothetical protein KEJ13_02415 [Candidatus Bathyarchaeota archaeon]|nr:hypothetical protein [Candidatus Bathyarchaeota archaeon]